MSSLAHNRPDKLWSRVKSSTKSISSSFSQLSIKHEKDGDAPTSTVVHKALVKFYTSQVPFQGFPDWLGHKEELPDQDKVLRKQKNHKHDPRSGEPAYPQSTQSSGNLSPKPSMRTAGRDFKEFYKAAPNDGSMASSYSSAPFQSRVTRLPSQNSSEQRTSSLLMRERLKRK
ncbi:LAMI_0A00650g1_1 [Lachancea mirantina]|uniref:LAMI_0A00650g1_1 n=1 Tax=Lachancea mirantina TaxID=1230905 RepID=A0A1G4IL67_9SACH|nr:LAMI_0A00650g1_1 [Lachancea mirantina]